ncbi:hypothetical protein XCR_2791 [Xanthomonas campestris pv. raphani 756C]|nr:hypothetical protein XCR_2791 [Xanthomonas campestris pv. raphani 756C]
MDGSILREADRPQVVLSRLGQIMTGACGTNIVPARMDYVDSLQHL